MYVITLASQKGGTGKTTLACHLAVAFTQTGQAVALLDLDPQTSAAEWGDVRESEFPHVQSLQPSRLTKTLEQMKEIGADVVIIDTAPHSEATVLDAARASDLVLIPCRPSIVDLRAISKTIALMKLVNVPAFAVLNGVQHHSLSSATEAATTITEHLGLSVCPVQIGERVAFSRCLISGQTAQEIDTTSKAAQEIDGLRKWTETVLHKRKAA